MKLLIASAFAIAATFASVSAEDGGCKKKKGDGCTKKDEPAFTITFDNNCKDGGCKKKGDGDGCKKKTAE